MSSDPFEVEVRFDSSAKVPCSSEGAALLTGAVDRDLRLRRLVIEGDSSSWFLVDIQVNFKSRMVQKKSLPGKLFGSDATGALDGLLDNAVIRKGSRLSIVVRYCGPNQTGSKFRGAVFGTDLTPRA